MLAERGVIGKGIDKRIITDLVGAASAAKESEDGLPALPARYHFFIRSPEGLFARLHSPREVFLSRRYEDGEGMAVFEIGICARCGKEYILGGIEEIDGRKYLSPKSGDYGDDSFKREYFMEIEDVAEEDSLDEDEKVAVPGIRQSRKGRYRVCLRCAAVWAEGEKGHCSCPQGKEQHRTVQEIDTNGGQLGESFS
jgi:hypothetical protein